jgi:hypothetical protein
VGPVGAESLARALEQLRLEGAIFLRAEYTEAWALDGQGGPFIAGMLRPGAERLIFFHVVANGRCWVAPADGERYWANTGEVIVLPYGDAHLMGGVEPAIPAPITSVVTPPPWDEFPVIRHGAGGARTDVVCGFLYSDDPLFEPSLRALPPALVLRPPPGPAQSWFDASITYALEASASPAPSGHRRNFPSFYSSRSCGSISPALPPLTEAGSPPSMIRFSPQRWQRFTMHPNGNGR